MATYQTPTDDQVKEALRRIPTPQLRRAFFEGLKNPLWVGPLAKQGVFNDPPEPERTDEGLTRDIYWPEIDYLVRVAPEAPSAVVDILLKLGKSNNAWVRRGVFAIGAAIPADQAARLKPIIKTWHATGFGWRTDPRELVDFAVNLLQGGEGDVGRWFASLIFKPAGVPGRRKAGFVLEEYWYAEGLPRVVSVLGGDDVPIVLSWLVAYQRHKGSLTKTFDLSFYSRDSIRVRGVSHEHVEQALIDAVRDLSIEGMLAHADVTKQLLLDSKMILGRKIALFALGEAIRQAGVDDQRLSKLVSVAQELLFDEDSSDDACRIDYAELARAVAGVSADALEPLTQYVGAGPRTDHDRLREWARGDETDEAEIDDLVQDHIDRWKHLWLSSIGLAALPAPLQSELARFDAKFGPIDSPLTPVNRVTTWTGPNSPITQDEMSSMSPPELIAHLESWHPDSDRRGPEPSHEGQARELTALITTNPLAVSGSTDLLARLRPTYLRAILRGWEAALQAYLELDWQQAAELISGVLTHDDASDFPAEGGNWDDDEDFRAAKQAAVGLLEDLVKKRTSIEIPNDSMAAFADLLINLGSDQTAWREYSASGESDMDPLTTSLNWQWPIRVRGLIHLMARGSDTPWYLDARSALETELGRDDARGAASAVLGEGLGRLLNVAPDWLKPKVPGWFGTATSITDAQQVALTTAMAIHHYHSSLYELLAPSMIAAVPLGESLKSGWRTQSDPLQRIGEWVIGALIYGHKTLDDPVASAFFSTAPPRVRGEAIGHIAWSFMHAQAVDDAIRDRFADLWDARVAHVRSNPEDRDELNGFFWFVKSKRFAIEWWLPRLKEAAELSPALAAERYMIGKELASSADVDPGLALGVLKLLLGVRDDAGVTAHDLTRNAVPMIIARAIASEDAELSRDAVTYMNQLGEQGNVSLEAEVQKVLNGGITQTDVYEG